MFKICNHYGEIMNWQKDKIFCVQSCPFRQVKVNHKQTGAKLTPNKLSSRLLAVSSTLVLLIHVGISVSLGVSFDLLERRTLYSLTTSQHFTNTNILPHHCITSPFPILNNNYSVYAQVN